MNTTHQISCQFRRTWWYTVILSLSLSLPYPLQAEGCRPSYVLGNDMVHLPCLEWLPTNPPTPPASRQIYQADLQLENAQNWSFRLANKTPVANPSTEVGATYNSETKNLYLPAIDVQTAPGATVAYQVMLHEGQDGLFRLTTAKPRPAASNHAPVATSLVQSVDSKTPVYSPIPLKGTDVDGDTLTYELLAPESGTGYTQAYLDPDSHLLYVMVVKDFTGTLKLPYRVSDGKQFSLPTMVTLNVGGETGQAAGLGSKRIGGRALAGLPLMRHGTAKLSKDSLKLPSQMDLSDRFPTPRDQGNQNSCVGWAVGYALKTYQEAVEMHWPLRDAAGNDVEEHLFSPSFIYNQIITRPDYGRLDQGITITDALQFLVDQGAATWKTMPYGSPFDPATEASTLEASNFKAKSWGALQTIDDVKRSLVNGSPVVISMAVYNSFKELNGPASIYIPNPTVDKYLGDHAVTIAGYDDGLAGGAFKVINSWGTDWGNGGYFWLPYDSLDTSVEINGQPEGSLLAGLFVLLNGNHSASLKAEPSPLVTNAPNLVLKNWKASYDPKPLGGGVLQYSLANLGTQAAIATVSTGLILSKQPTVTLDNYANDIYYMVEFEDNQMTLEPNQEVKRDDTNLLPFLFPSFPPGTYYLHLLLKATTAQGTPLLEQTLEDNVLSSANTITFTSDLPDLAVNYFYVEWDRQTGDGKLDYSIVNQGNSPAPANLNWLIRLGIVYDAPCSGKPETTCREVYDVWEHRVNEELAPLAGRDPKSLPAPFFVAPEQAIAFNMYKPLIGDYLPPGDYNYQLLFDIDVEQVVEQSFYDNDYSFGEFVTITNPNYDESGGFEFPHHAADIPDLSAPVSNQSSQTRHGVRDTILRSYNGKGVSSRLNTNHRRMRILPDGQRRLEKVTKETSKQPFEKENHARNQVIWPTDNIIYLPPVKVGK